MRTLSILILLFGLSILGKAQIELSKKQIQEKTDSILIEGNLLYKYEKAAWISYDLAMEKKSIKKDFGGYLIYKDGDAIKTTILDEENKFCTYELTFITDFNKPTYENLTKRELTENEEKLLNIKNKILNEIIEKKYEVGCPEGYSLNKILIPFNQGYKLYIITGTSQSQIIPFGNDYLFYADENGDVTSWKKFHSRLISTQTKGPNGEAVRELTHSHLRIEPFISATDICTFKLYGILYNIDEFSVYSPELSIYFTYNLKKDTIKIKDK